MDLLLLVVGFGVVLTLAIKGKGYRGLYVAGVILSVFCAYCTNEMTGPISPTATESERIGSEFFNTIGTPIFAMFVGVGFASLLGAALFRGPKRPLEMTTRCPYCAEQILAAAVICKHCKAVIHQSERIGGDTPTRP